MCNKPDKLFDIELHGFSSRRFTEIEKTIRDLLKEKKYLTRFVTIFMNNEVFNYFQRFSPYIRLAVTTKNEHTDDLIEELKKLEYDIEVIELTRFVTIKLKPVEK